jgi:hypothetical protein
MKEIKEKRIRRKREKKGERKNDQSIKCARSFVLILLRRGPIRKF